MTNNLIVLERDRRLRPIEGQALARSMSTTAALSRMDPPRNRIFFKPGVVFALFMAAGGLVAFLIGALSL